MTLWPTQYSLLLGVVFNILLLLGVVFDPDILATIDHIQKCFSVREGSHTRTTYFFIGGGAEATSRSTPLF